jgi:hypothetical protein
VSDKRPPHIDYALRVRNKRWSLVVALPSVAEAAAVVERVARGSDAAIKVAVEVYNPEKDTFEHKDYLTFGGRRPKSALAVCKLVRRDLLHFSLWARLSLAAVAIPVLALAGLGAYGLAVPGTRAPAAVAPGTAEIVIPPPSRALPREWTGIPQAAEIPPVFQGEWSASCTAARLDGAGTMTVTSQSFFGQPVNWVRVAGPRALVNTGPRGASKSTLVHSDGLALFLDDRFAEDVQTNAERARFSPEHPAILAKCL